MITFSRLGRYGNFGNQLHQVASLIGFCEKYQCSMVLPSWKYAKYFEGPFAQGDIPINLCITESDYHYVPEFWDEHADNFRTKNCDITGWLQSEKYWDHCKEKVHSAFSFKREFAQEVRSKFEEILNKKTIAISIRRGDFVTNPNFYLLPLGYYAGALVKFFPKHKNYNIIVFSDDTAYCRTYFKSLPNVYFADNFKDVEQLCLMSMCDHFIISNSSFSWWGAMLGEKAQSIVVRSPFQLSGKLLKRFNTKDYYPRRWHIFDHTTEKMDVSFFLTGRDQPVSLSPLTRLGVRLGYYTLKTYCYTGLASLKRKIKVKS